MSDKETPAETQLRLVRERQCAELANKIRGMMPPGRGFLLMTADYGDAHEMFQSIEYMSTIRRQDAVVMLLDWLARYAQPEDIERAERERVARGEEPIPE